MNCLRMVCSTGMDWSGPLDAALAHVGQRDIFDVTGYLSFAYSV